MDCEVVFFPNKANEIKIIDFINQAKKELKNIALAILNKVLKDKVKVRIITDDVQNESKYSIVDVLQSASDDLIKFRTDLRKDAHMHHKYVVIDDKYIATGSFNWTQAAVMKNNENLLLISNPSIAKQFSKNFEELWDQFKSTEISLSKLASDIKERGATFKTKYDKTITQGPIGKPQANGRGQKKEQNTKNNKKDEEYIQIIDEEDEEEEEKVKKSRKPSKPTGQQQQSGKGDETPKTPRKYNRQAKKVDDCGETLQKKENKEKSKKIKKVLKMSKIMQTKRVILTNKMSEIRQNRIKSLIHNAISFTLGALTAGSCFFLQKFF